LPRFLAFLDTSPISVQDRVANAAERNSCHGTGRSPIWLANDADICSARHLRPTRAGEVCPRARRLVIGEGEPAIYSAVLEHHQHRLLSRKAVDLPEQDNCWWSGIFWRRPPVDERGSEAANDRSHIRRCRSCNSAELMSISRSGFYHQPAGETDQSLTLMRLIDEQFLETPWYGSRQMVRHSAAPGPRGRAQADRSADGT
jgi:hypothetical protein